MDLFEAPAVVILPHASLDRLVAGAAQSDAVASMVVVSVRGVAAKRTMLSRLAEGCEAPAYVRPNWDSLDEWLRDLSWMPVGGRVIVVADTDDFRLGDPDAWSTLLAVATDAVGWHGSGAAPLWLVLVGRT